MILQSMPYPPLAGGPALPSTWGELRGGPFDANALDATLNNNDDVPAWACDGGAYSATGGSSKQKFLTNAINGRGAVQSVSGNDGMALPAAFLDGLNGIDGATVIYVGQLAPSISGGALFGDFGNNSPHHYPWIDGNVYESIFGSDRPSFGNATTAMQAWHVGVFRAKNGYIDWRIAGSQRYNSASWTFVANGSSTGQPPRLFQSYRGGLGAAWAGKLAWWALGNRSFTDPETVEFEDFLSDPSMFAL